MSQGASQLLDVHLNSLCTPLQRRPLEQRRWRDLLLSLVTKWPVSVNFTPPGPPGQPGGHGISDILHTRLIITIHNDSEVSYEVPTEIILRLAVCVCVCE